MRNSEIFSVFLRPLSLETGLKLVANNEPFGNARNPGKSHRTAAELAETVRIVVTFRVVYELSSLPELINASDEDRTIQR